MRQAGLGKEPDERERDLLTDLSAQMTRLARDESLDPQLRDAFAGVARTADWLLDPGEGTPIIDLGPSG